MPETPLFDKLRKTQTSLFEGMRRKQETARLIPTAEDEALEEDWTLPVVGAIGLAAMPVYGVAVGVATGVGALVGEVASVGAGKLAGQIDPRLELPTYLATGILHAATAEKWLFDAFTKAPRQLPKFWKKEFELATKKGILPKQFTDDYANIISKMDMGDTKAKEQLINIFKQEAYEEKIAKVGKHLEKLAKVTPPKVTESIEKVIKKLKKKRFLEDKDYQHLARIAKEDAVMEYTTKFAETRNNIINKVANEKWQAHEMKDVMETIIRDGGISPKYKFASPELAKEFFRRHPNLRVSKAVSANLVKIADDFGYANLNEMVSKIYHTPNSTIFKRRAATELAPEFKRIYNDEVLLRIAEKESDYLFKLHGKTTGFEEGRLLKQKHIEALRRAEDTLPAKLVIREVTSLKKAVSQLLKVIQKPVKDTAKLDRLREVYNSKLANYQAAVKVKTGLALINTRLKSALGMKGEYGEQLNNLLTPLFPKTKMIKGIPQQIRKPLKKLDESMFMFLSRKYNDEFSIGADILLKKYDAMLKTFPFQQRDFLTLTLKQAKDLDDFVRTFKFVAKNDLYVTIKADKMLVKTLAKTINRSAQTTVPKIKMFRAKLPETQLEALSKGKFGAVAATQRSTADLLNGGLAALKRIEPICYQLDGFKKFGPAWKSIYNKINIAFTSEEQLGQRIFGHYKKIFDTHTASHGKNPAKYWSATSGNLAGHDIPKEYAFFMHMNFSSLANREAMLKGLGVTSKTLSDFLEGALNKADLKLADDIFDFFDETFPMIAKVFKEKTGRTLQKTTDGRHFPILADMRYAKPSEVIDDFFLETSSELFQAKVTDTFVHLRKGGVKAVKLNFQSLTQHLTDMVHYSTHYTPINEVQRLTRNADFKSAVETTMGKHVYAQFDPWLQNLAKPSRTKIDSWIGRRRRNVTFANLAFIPKTAVKQTLSFLTAMPQIGYVNAITSLKEYITNPLHFSNAIKKADPSMANRARSWNRDLADITATFDIKSNKGGLLKMGFYMIHKVDDVTSSVVWLGAYKKGLKLYKGNGNMAVNYAAEVVRNTQPASAAKDIPRIMRSGEGWRATAMFYSYWSVYHNQVGTIVNKALSKHMTPSQVIGTLTWLAVAPAITQHLAGTAWDSLTGREQEEMNLKEIGKGSIGNTVGGVPLAREVVNSMAHGFDPRFSPMARILDDTVTVGNIPFKTFDPEKDLNKYDLYGAAKLASYFSLVPSRAMITAVEGALRLYEDETDDWSEVIDRPRYEK